MTQINAYLKFNGNCREAMQFYKECLGGELTMQTAGESPMSKEMPPEAQNQIIHSSLKKGEEVFLYGCDWLTPGAATWGTAISLSLQCESDGELRTLLSKLSSGGKVTLPASPSFWGGTFGMLVDKFGNEWMLNYQKPAQ